MGARVAIEVVVGSLRAADGSMMRAITGSMKGADDGLMKGAPLMLDGSR
jgi:hypothetical protein